MLEQINSTPNICMNYLKRLCICMSVLQVMVLKNNASDAGLHPSHVSMLR